MSSAGHTMMAIIQESVCFICDKGTSDSGIPLQFGHTTHSKTGLPIKLRQLIGDDFMVIVSVDDRLCLSCITLIDHADQLEIELDVVKKVITDQLLTKYNLSEAVEDCGVEGGDNGNNEDDDDDDVKIVENESSKDQDNEHFEADLLHSDHSVAVFQEPSEEATELLQKRNCDLNSIGKPELPGESLSTNKINRVIKSIKTLKCSKYCDFKSDDEVEFKSHKLKCSTKLPQCNICNETFQSNVLLRKHIIYVHLNKWSCRLCCLTFKSESKYSVHMETHRSKDSPGNGVDVNPRTPTLKDCYTCKYCKFKTDLESVFDEHQCSSLKCLTCKNYFQNSEELNLHVCCDEAYKYQCGICTSLLNDKASLIMHLRTHKTDLAPEAKAITEDIEVDIDLNASGVETMQYRCNVCSLSFDSETSYMEHACENKNKDKTETEVYFDNVEHFMAFSEPSKEGGLKIDYVNKVFSDSDEKTEILQVICDTCDTAFDDKPNLEKHQLLTGHKILKYILKPDQNADESFKVDVKPGNDAQDESESEVVPSSITELVGDTLLSDAQFSSKVEGMTEDDVFRLNCEECSFIAQSFNELQMHKMNVHMMKCDIYFHCSVCDRYVLKSHEKEHSKIHGPFSCHVCPFEAKSKRLLKKHVQEHKRQNQEYLCQFCSEKFKTKKALKNHEESHPESFGFHCPECDQRFMKEKQLKVHHDENHRDAHCRFCNKQILNLKALKNHEQRHKKVCNNSKLECDICKRVFKTRTGLRHHFANHTGKFKYFCEFCQRGFMSRMMLEEHRSRHTKEERYVCDVCGRKFTFQSTYWIHRKWHDNPFPYKCNFCGRLFRHTSLLAVHKRKHTGERPYKCPHCPMSFAVGGTLKRHMILHTLNFPYICETCERGFTTRHKYSVHLAKAHDNFALLNKSKMPSEQEDFKMVVREKVGEKKDPPDENQDQTDSFEFMPDSNFTLVNMEEENDGSGSPIMAPCIMTAINNEESSGRVFEIILGSPLNQISSIPLSETATILPDMWCQ